MILTSNESQHWCKNLPYYSSTSNLVQRKAIKLNSWEPCGSLNIC